MPLFSGIFGRSHLCLGFESELAQIGQQMAKDLEPIAVGEAIELKHDRGIKRSDIAMPDVGRDSSKEDIGVTAFERLGNGSSGIEWRCRKYSRRKSPLMRVAFPRTITS